MSKSMDTEIKLFGRTIKSNLYDQTVDPSSSSPMVNIISRFKDPYEPPKATTPLKKPDKILSCPRCQSSNTKFCYYNNYNVNQPRYFCRNCQRYWTAGGSMRSVPIGSGRRKNKTSPTSNHYLHINSQDDLNTNKNTNTNHSPTILTFGSTESSVTEIGKHQSGDTKNYEGFLASQVTFPNSSPWSYQWSPTGPNTDFYPMHFYWGGTLPLCPTLETTTCLGKRSRDEIEGGCKDNTRTRFVSESLRPSEAVLSKLLENTGKTQGFNVFSGFETKGSNRRSLVTETSHNLQANPAAMSRSMNFRESIQH